MKLLLGSHKEKKKEICIFFSYLILYIFVFCDMLASPKTQRQICNIKIRSLEDGCQDFELQHLENLQKTKVLHFLQNKQASLDSQKKD